MTGYPFIAHRDLAGGQLSNVPRAIPHLSLIDPAIILDGDPRPERVGKGAE